ncbi:MAG: TolC family protein [Balneolales bacterium]
MPIYATAQDTIRVSLEEFINRGIETSSLLDAERQNIDLAENTSARARGARILPNIELTTAHGLVPGIISREPSIDEGSLYLDPNLENDWENWGIFTQAELSALQPIYTWGAINNAINAAQAGADASRYEYNVERNAYEMQLFELYYGRVLAIEMDRLLDEATEQLNRAEKMLEQMIEDGDPDLEQAEVYKFNLFRYEFASQAEEVKQNVSFVEEAWRLALKTNDQVVFFPEQSFLDPLTQGIQEATYYELQAINNRPEIKGLELAGNAAKFGIKANRAQLLPGLFLGLQGRFAYTPNRPRQTNPFIINNTNYGSGSFGVGIRQNLDFSGMKRDIQRAEAQSRQVKYFKDAAVDGITLELNEQYRDLRITEARVNNTREALNTSNAWLRQEQIDYDLGFTDVENLVDAVRSNLELEVAYRQRVFEYNLALARMHFAAGLPLKDIE